MMMDERLPEVDVLTQQQKKLEQEVESKENKINEYDARIDSLKKALEKANQVALAETSEDKIIQDLRTAYDQSARNIFGITLDEKTRSGRIFKNKFIAIATDIAKLATLAKNSEESLREQKDLLERIRGLEDEISALKTENTNLEKEKSQHYMNAYNEAYASFQLLHKNYVELLKAPPKVEFDLAPKWLQIVGGAVGGIAIGTLAK